MLIVSYGGGTNSKAVVIGLYERGIIPDAILFADTGGEMPHTYSDLREMQIWLGKVGFPLITTVKKVDKNGDVLTLEDNCLDKKMLPSVAYGFKTCSQKYKAQPQEKWLNNWEPSKAVWKSGAKVTKVIGFDADEPGRAEKDYSCKKYDYWYPLLDWDWGREECKEAIARAGLSQPGKSSCFFCPNARPSEIRELNAVYPELMDRAITMEKNAILTTIKGLGRGHYAWSDVIATSEMFPFPGQEMPCACYDG
jgi:hypothetical protein